MEADGGWLRLLLNLLLIPVGLVVLVPLAVLVALWFYLAACKEALRLLLRAMLGRRGEESVTRVLPAPHFSEPRTVTHIDIPSEEGPCESS
jgi:hypothetical protein